MRSSILAFLPAMVLTTAGFLFSFHLSAQQNYYSVKFPDDRTIVSCGGSADTIYPEITYYSNCNFNVGVSVKDQVFHINNTGGCKKILRTWKLIWWCDYNPNWPGPSLIDNPGSTDIGPTVMGNTDNHGYLQYTQIIKIIDNVPPVYTSCPSSTVLFCDYTNNDPAQYGANCEGPVNLQMKVTDACSKSDLLVTYRLYLDLDGNGSMETFLSSSAPGAWPIEKTILGDTVCARVVLPSGVGLPYGKHKIEWITNDRCGNEALCKYEFEVRDCKAPTVVCMNGLSINIMQTGMITLWDTDFLQYTYDNCTPAAQIKIAIRKSGTGTGFPYGVHSVTFDCNEIGKQLVEIWAVDAYGNADYCETFVIVQDHLGACTPPGPVSGSIVNDQQQPLAEAKILLKSNLDAVPVQSLAVTDAQGNYTFASAPGTCNYSIIPTLDETPQKGVNTLDVLLTDQYISGQIALANPYRIVAADANHDGQLNALDLNAMNDLIVGTATAFPNNTAWRFVPSSFVFPDPAKPLSVLMPEKISTICPGSSGENQSFVAIKTGDVDGSAMLSNKEGGDDLAIFYTKKRRFFAGEMVEVAIQTSMLSQLAGFQFTLEANPAYLVLQSVAPGTISPRMGVDLDQNRVAVSWYSTIPVEDDQTVMILKFKALQTSSLLQSLHLNSSVAHAEAYDQTLKTMSAALQFDMAGARNYELSQLDNELSAQLFPVSPNPSAGPVPATFFLPEAGEAMLSLTDLNGRIVASKSAYFEKGNHQIELPVEESGLYFLNLKSDKGCGVQRVLVHR